MKNSLPRPLRLLWSVVTEIPGWPNAPLYRRAIWSLPIAFPIVALVAGAVWHYGVYEPRLAAQRQQIEPLKQLETGVLALRAETTEKRLVELNAEAAKASLLLLESKDQLPSVLREIKQRALAQGWEASFQPADEEASATNPGSIQYLPVRGKLRAKPDNTAPYPTLVALLEGFSSFPKRIDLTRLAIRADENRWQSVEVTLRLAGQSSNAKIP